MMRFEVLSVSLQERHDVLARRLMLATRIQNLWSLHLLGRLLPDVVIGFNEVGTTVFKDASQLLSKS